MNTVKRSNTCLLLLISIFFLLLICPFPIYGSEEKSQPDVFTLGVIEVTDGTGKTKNTTIETVTVKEMRDFNKDDVQGAVNMLPGVTLSNRAARNEKTLYVRGFDIKYVPLYLDGIPIYVPYDGYPDLGRFTTFDLSEIVLSKGFTSVLYGPNTMGGAINMVSRRPEKVFEGEAGAGYASGNTYRGYINLGSRQKNWYIQGGASLINSDYFPLSGDYKPLKTEDGGQRENSYFRDWKFNIKLGLTPNETDEYALSFIKQHGEKGTPPYDGKDRATMARYWQWPYWDKSSLYFTSKTTILDKSYIKTRLYYDKYDNALTSFDNVTYTTTKKKSSFRSDYDDYTYGGSIEAGTTLIPHNTLKIAVHYKKDIHKEHNKPDPYQRYADEIFSVGLEDTIQFTKKFYTIIGISYDYYRAREAETYNAKTKIMSDFLTGSTSAFNPQIGFFYDITETGKLHASVSAKTRFPTIKDRYSYRLGTAIPNEHLKPERAIHYEVGYQDLFFKVLKIRSNIFYSDIRDYIQFVRVPDPNNPGKLVNQNQNFGKVSQYGFELEFSAAIGDRFEGGFNYTYLFRDNKSTSSRLIDTPKNKIFAFAKYDPIKGLTLFGNIEYDSFRYCTADGVQAARAFAVANFKTGYEVMKGLTVEAGVNNIFDRNYQISEGYPEAGRTYFMNMRYAF